MSKTKSDIAAALDNPQPAPSFAEPGEFVPDREDGRRERRPFPRDCPVKPLGQHSDINSGTRCYFLNALGEIVGFEAGNKINKGNMLGMFGPDVWFLESEQGWPKYSRPDKDGKFVVVGWDSGKAQEALIEECGRKGIFDPAGRMRGRGAHPMPSGGIAVHYGDQVLFSKHRASGDIHDFEFREPGLIDRMVYPASDPYPHPWPHDPGPGTAIALEKLLRTWRWKRGEIDAHLALGGVARAK